MAPALLQHTTMRASTAPAAAKQTRTPAAQRGVVLCHAALQPMSSANTSSSGQGFRLSSHTSSSSRVVGVREASSSNGISSPSWATGAIIGLVVAFVGTKAKAIWEERQGSMQQADGRQRKDIFASNMKGVNTVPMPSLSDEAITAARARRQKERANHKLQLEDIELPPNHPWATRAVQDGERVRAPLRRSRQQPPPEGPDGSAGRAARRAFSDDGAQPQQQGQQQEQRRVAAASNDE